MLAYSTIFSIFAMSKKEKLISRFCTLPKDFTFEEMVRLFGYFGYSLNNKGITSGSRVTFTKGAESYNIHKPHPNNIMGHKTLYKAFKYLTIKNLL